VLKDKENILQQSLPTRPVGMKAICSKQVSVSPEQIKMINEVDPSEATRFGQPGIQSKEPAKLSDSFSDPLTKD